MATTRCKFQCQSVTKTLHWDRSGKFLHTAKFSAVTDGSDENKQFFAATPSGSIEVGTYVPDVFEVGKAYYVDLTPADG